jgi:hypothetical protein
MKKVLMFISFMLLSIFFTSCRHGLLRPFAGDTLNLYDVIENLDYVGIFKVEKIVSREPNDIPVVRIKPIEFIINKTNLNLDSFNINLFEDYLKSTSWYEDKYLNKYCLLGGGEKLPAEDTHYNGGRAYEIFNNYNESKTILEQDSNILKSVSAYISAANQLKYIYYSVNESLDVACFYIDSQRFDDSPYIELAQNETERAKLMEIYWEEYHAKEAYYQGITLSFIEANSTYFENLDYELSPATPSFYVTINHSDYLKYKPTLDTIASLLTFIYF